MAVPAHEHVPLTALVSTTEYKLETPHGHKNRSKLVMARMLLLLLTLAPFLQLFILFRIYHMHINVFRYILRRVRARTAKSQIRSTRIHTVVRSGMAAILEAEIFVAHVRATALDLLSFGSRVDRRTVFRPRRTRHFPDVTDHVVELVVVLRASEIDGSGCGVAVGVWRRQPFIAVPDI